MSHQSTRSDANRHCFKGIVVLIAMLCISWPIKMVASQPASMAPEVRYYSLLDEVEKWYSAGKLAEMMDALREIASLRVLEVPTYELNFYEAVKLEQEHRRYDALAKLASFRDMLSIDSGVARCESKEGIISVRGTSRASSEAYKAMCAAYFIAYYDKPTCESLRRIARYWALADDLRSRIEQEP